MKKIICFLVVFILISEIGTPIENPILIESKISEVTVFLRGAQVVRTGTIQLNAGTSEIMFYDLPDNLNAESIQVSGKGNFTILSVIHQINYLKAQEKSPEVVDLEKKLKELEMKVAGENVNLSVYTHEENILLANKSIGGQATGVKAIDLKEAVDFFRSRLLVVKTKQLEISQSISKLNEEINRIKQQLSTLSSKRKRPTSEVICNVSSTATTKASFEISYIVTNAGWVPSYDVRAKDIKNPIEINYKAKVYQATGENWEKVPLILSTGNPSNPGIKPTIYPWYLSFVEPYTLNESVAVRGAASMKKAERSMAPEAEFNAEEALSLSDFTQVTEAPTSIEFNISIPYTIPSDGKQHMVDLQKHTLPASYEYYAAPKIDRDAFLLARVTGWEELNLLSGEMNLFFEGTFVGKSFLNVRNTKDTLDLSLGRDKGIVITRDDLKDFSSRKVIGFNREEVRTWEITLRNTKNSPVNINLEDQFPLSTNKEIEIKHLEMAGADFQKDSGKLIWRMTLDPAQNKKYRLSFSVKYPKNRILNL